MSDFPGSNLELDLLTAIARIEQIGREGADTCGGLILDRLVTCDAPRLRGHISTPALEWGDAASAANRKFFEGLS